MMDSPYVTASRMPFLRSSLARLRKKLTVIGMIGHTHGVSRATRPPAMPMKKIAHRDLLPPSFVLLNADSSLMTGFHRSASGVACTLACCAETAESACGAVPVPAVSAVMVARADKPSAATGVAAVVVLSVSVLAAVGAAAGAEAGPLLLKLNSSCIGGMHISSLQAPYSR